jgi:hypothetical protein
MALGWKLSLLGLTVSGDVAGMTIYTDRYGRKNWFRNAPPKKPPTQKQLWFRQRFKAVQLSWRLLSDADKAALERASNKLSLCATGQNLFLSCSLRSAVGVYRTIARQSGEVLPPLASV